MIFAEVIFPILEDFAALVSSFLEVFTTSFQTKSMKNGKEIAKMKKEIEDTMHCEEENTHVIGFAMSSSADDDEEEEEDV